MTINEKISYKDDGIFVELDGCIITYAARADKSDDFAKLFKGASFARRLCKVPPQNIKKLLDENYEVVSVDFHSATLTIYKNG